MANKVTIPTKVIKPTLVPESDKRPALNTAKDDFSEE